MKKYVCTVCGYIAEGSIPEQCPVCKAPASAFVEKTGNTYVTEHVVGIGKAEGVPQEIVDGLRANFEAECGACSGKMDLAKKAKALNLDAIHDTVHEMAKDEARHGRGFEGLLKRYFNVEL